MRTVNENHLLLLICLQQLCTQSFFSVQLITCSTIWNFRIWKNALFDYISLSYRRELEYIINCAIWCHTDEDALISEFSFLLNVSLLLSPLAFSFEINVCINICLEIYLFVIISAVFKVFFLMFLYVYFCKAALWLCLFGCKNELKWIELNFN